MSPWNYNAIKPEHYVPIETRPKLMEECAKYYPDRKFTYVEETPFCENFMNKAPRMAADGYKIVPCVSICFNCDENTGDMLEYFQEIAPDHMVYGYITAPWGPTIADRLEKFKKSIRLLNTERERVYGR